MFLRRVKVGGGRKRDALRAVCGFIRPSKNIEETRRPWAPFVMGDRFCTHKASAGPGGGTGREDGKGDQ